MKELDRFGSRKIICDVISLNIDLFPNCEAKYKFGIRKYVLFYIKKEKLKEDLTSSNHLNFG